MKSKFFTLFFCIFGAVDAYAQQIGLETKLMCFAPVNRQMIYRVLVINYSANTVDGRKAVISDDFIKWSSAEKSKDRMEVVRHELNRLSGTYSSYADGAIYASPPPIFNCEKAPAAKF